MSYRKKIHVEHRKHQRTTYVRETRNQEWATTARPYRAPAKLLASALRGRFAVQLFGVSRTCLAVVDIDAHHVRGAAEDFDARARAQVEGEDVRARPTWEGAGFDLDAFAKRARAKEGRVRLARRDLVTRDAIATFGAPLARLERLARGAVAIERRSSGGLHVGVLFSMPEDASEVEGVVCRLLGAAGFGDGAPVEVFPRASGDQRMCALPLTGPSTMLLDASGAPMAPRHRRRIVDVEKFLALPTVALSDLAAVGRPSSRARAPDAPAQPATAARAAVSSGREGAPKATPSRGTVHAHLFAQDFAEATADLVVRGMRAGESFDSVRKLIAALVYYDERFLDGGQALAAFDAWIARGNHDAEHAQTDRGIAKLRAVVRAAVRHAHRGVERGDVQPGGLKRRELVTALDSLLAEAGIPRCAESTDRDVESGPRRKKRAPAKGEWLPAEWADEMKRREERGRVAGLARAARAAASPGVVLPATAREQRDMARAGRAFRAIGEVVALYGGARPLFSFR